MIDSKLTLINYGVILRRLTHDKIEMMRQWRNDPKIQQYMQYREHITPEMQEHWFEKINNDANLYFIIDFEGEEVGVINIKGIDNENHFGEGGIFIYDDRVLNRDVSYRAHLLLFDYAFKEIGLQGITSEILQSNQRAIRFAEFLGSKRQTIKKSEYGEIACYLLTKDNYFNNKNRIHFIKRWEFYNKD